MSASRITFGVQGRYQDPVHVHKQCSRTENSLPLLLPVGTCSGGCLHQPSLRHGSSVHRWTGQSSGANPFQGRVPAHSPHLGILSQPRSRAGEQQVPSDPKFISSFNPSNSPMRLFCYLIVTVKGKTCYYTQVTGGTIHKFSNHGAHGGKGRAVGPTPPCRCAQAWPELTMLPRPNSLLPDFQSPRQETRGRHSLQV